MDSETLTPPFRMTSRAAARIAAISTEQGGGFALRLAVDAGGCSGFQYKFDLQKHAEPDDFIVEGGGAKIFIDPASMEFLAGSELDFTEALMGAHFEVRNPNASSSCGCGTSFSVD